MSFGFPEISLSISESMDYDEVDVWLHFRNGTISGEKRWRSLSSGNNSRFQKKKHQHGKGVELGDQLMDGIDRSLCVTVLDQEREVSESFEEGEQKRGIQGVKRWGRKRDLIWCGRWKRGQEKPWTVCQFEFITWLSLYKCNTKTSSQFIPEKK